MKLSKKQRKWLKDNKFRYYQPYHNYYKEFFFKNGFISIIMSAINEDGNIFIFGDLQDRCNKKAKKLVKEWKKLRKENNNE